MSVYYKIAKKNYDNGMWNRAMIDHLYEIGRLTRAEHDDIVGHDDD